MEMAGNLWKLLEDEQQLEEEERSLHLVVGRHQIEPVTHWERGGERAP